MDQITWELEATSISMVEQILELEKIFILVEMPAILLIQEMPMQTHSAIKEINSRHFWVNQVDQVDLDQVDQTQFIVLQALHQNTLSLDGDY